MAQHVKSEISIGGSRIAQFSSFSLTQGIYCHHTFSLVCPAQTIDGRTGDILNASKNLVGKTIAVQMDTIGSQGSLHFSGVVTQVEAARSSGRSDDVIISGYSPTILLDNGVHFYSWEKQPLEKIAQEVLSGYAHNLLQSAISPVYKDPLPYTVQYRESAWCFLKRLSAQLGEWLFYDGERLKLGTPQSARASLIFGSNLSRFKMVMQVNPVAFDMVSYNYEDGKVYTGSPSALADAAGLNELGKHALQKSNQFYTRKTLQWHNDPTGSQKDLKEAATTQAALLANEFVRFNGNSGHPGLKPGGMATIQGQRSFDQGSESYGDYTIVSVTHHCDGLGNYKNNFTAVPSSIKYPPIPPAKAPHCEPQTALVTDNNDPNKMGRIRVKFHWMNGSAKSPWIRVAGLHGGNEKGSFFLPEIGEEVIMGFECDDAIKPYVIGTVFNGKQKNANGSQNNDIKAIQTRSGNKIVMNDKDGSIQISDAKGNSVLWDGQGNIKAQATESIVLTCGQAKIELKKDGTITMNGKDISLHATNKVSIAANTKAVLGSGAASFTADGAKNEANMAGMKANVKGSMEANISSSAKTTISAAVKVAAQAPMITLN